MRKKDSILNLSIFLYLFLAFQTINITFFLLHKSNQVNLDFQIYLNSIKFSTLILLIFALTYILKNFKSLVKNLNIITYASLGIMFSLYFTMIIHTDKLAISSPTIFLMLCSFLIFSIIQIDLNKILNIIFTITFINFIFVMLQILDLIPIAQENVRESLFVNDNRPTGLFFNAFALGYAMAIFFIIFVYNLLNREYKFVNISGALFSFLALYFSGTRTSTLLVFGLIILIFLMKSTNSRFLKKYVVLSTVGLILISPFIIISLGSLFNISSLQGLNGRTQLWNCVLDKWTEFIPFGVGVQAAFPQGFCSDDVWFSKLRHPENMFLINYVEAGLLGVLTLISLFVVAFYLANKAVKAGNLLPWAISTLYLLSSLFYVPLFHYLPFLPNRTADRGVFNYFLITLIWIIFLKYSSDIKIEKNNKK